MTDIVDRLRDLGKVISRRLLESYRGSDERAAWIKANLTLRGARSEIERLRRDLASKQAEIDALMLEHCPGEMTPQQMEEWARHQRPSFVPPDAEVSVVEWPKL